MASVFDFFLDAPMDAFSRLSALRSTSSLCLVSAWGLLFLYHLLRGWKFVSDMEMRSVMLVYPIVAVVLASCLQSIIVDPAAPTLLMVLPLPFLTGIVWGRMAEDSALVHALSRWLWSQLARLYHWTNLHIVIRVLCGLLKFYGWWHTFNDGSFLKDAGFTAVDLIKFMDMGILKHTCSGRDFQFLKDSGYTLHELSQIPSVDPWILRHSGFSPAEIEAAGIPWLISVQAVLVSGKQILGDDYTVEPTHRMKVVLDDVESLVKKQCVLAYHDAPLKDVSTVTVHECGLKSGSTEILTVWVCAASRAKRSYWSISDLKAAGYTGYTDQELLDAGYSPQELDAAGYKTEFLYDYADLLCTFGESDAPAPMPAFPKPTRLSQNLVDPGQARPGSEARYEPEELQEEPRGVCFDFADLLNPVDLDESD